MEKKVDDESDVNGEVCGEEDGGNDEGTLVVL